MKVFDVMMNKLTPGDLIFFKSDRLNEKFIKAGVLVSFDDSNEVFRLRVKTPFKWLSDSISKGYSPNTTKGFFDHANCISKIENSKETSIYYVATNVIKIEESKYEELKYRDNFNEVLCLRKNLLESEIEIPKEELIDTLLEQHTNIDLVEKISMEMLEEMGSPFNKLKE